VGEPVIATTSTLSATLSLIQSLTTTPPNRFPFSRQGPRQLLEQSDNVADKITSAVPYHTSHMRFKYFYSFASTYRIPPNLCWVMVPWHTRLSCGTPCLMRSGGNKLLRSPLYGHSKTWGSDRMVSQKTKKGVDAPAA